jgi:hypothetical protein
MSDDELAAMLQGGGQQDLMDPIQLQAAQMEAQLANDPQMQLQMMAAARRMGGF